MKSTHPLTLLLIKLIDLFSLWGSNCYFLAYDKDLLQISNKLVPGFGGEDKNSTIIHGKEGNRIENLANIECVGNQKNNLLTMSLKFVVQSASAFTQNSLKSPIVSFLFSFDSRRRPTFTFAIQKSRSGTFCLAWLLFNKFTLGWMKSCIERAGQSKSEVLRACDCLIGNMTYFRHVALKRFNQIMSAERDQNMVMNWLWKKNLHVLSFLRTIYRDYDFYPVMKWCQDFAFS